LRKVAFSACPACRGLARGGTGAKKALSKKPMLARRII
jgi:hypothetical protein